MVRPVIGIAVGIPPWQIDNMDSAVVKRADGDPNVFKTVEEAFKTTLIGKKFLEEWPEAEIATKFEGHPEASSKHAAGLVITEKPVIEYVAINSKSPRTAMCDKKDAEDLNLLKIDALGLARELVLVIADDLLEDVLERHQALNLAVLVHHQTKALLEAAGSMPRIGHEAKEIHTALSLVAAGLGATVVGRSVAINNRTDIRFLPITDITIQSRVIAVRKANSEHRHSESLLGILRGQLKKLETT